jgi:transcription initiation factor TFIIA large subunit
LHQRAQAQQQQQQQQQVQQPHIKSEPGSQGQYAQSQNGGVKIKAEPGLDPQGIYSAANTIPGNPTHDPQLAAMRAQQNIAQKFGNQLQARPTGGLVLPGMQPGAVQQQHQHQHQHQQHRPANGQHNGIPQHDGGDDEDILIEGFGSFTREQADRVLLTRIGKAQRERAKATQDLQKALEDLKVSSSESKGKGKAKASRKIRSRRVRKMDAYEEALDSKSSYPYPPTALFCGETSSAPRVPQLDGESEGDVADEDAINSDLDDPEDDEIDSEDGDEVPQIMLCMYDKVQRTKNKWKCVLKDGVLTINGQEYALPTASFFSVTNPLHRYVFHKANGEYEW